MTTLFYPGNRLPTTSDRRQASLGGYTTLKRLKTPLVAKGQAGLVSSAVKASRNRGK
eukprot:COSAG01_NODE_59909_length_297_cov_1.262626_1_plen_56_part_10